MRGLSPPGLGLVTQHGGPQGVPSGVQVVGLALEEVGLGKQRSRVHGAPNVGPRSTLRNPPLDAAGAAGNDVPEQWLGSCLPQRAALPLG